MSETSNCIPVTAFAIVEISTVIAIILLIIVLRIYWRHREIEAAKYPERILNDTRLPGRNYAARFNNLMF